MVTRLESGRIQLNAPGGAPMERVVPQQVDYMTAAREEARGLGVRADVIDRMSQSVFGAAKELAEQEAIKYVAANPPDRTQFMIAAGFDPATGEFRGVPAAKNKDAPIAWTAFDKTYQKYRAAQVAGLIKEEGLHQIANMLKRVDTEGVSNFGSEKIEKQIETMIVGFEAAARSESPAAAVEVRASLAAHGYTAIQKARELEFKAAQEQRLIKLDQTYEDRLAILKEGFQIDPENAPFYADVFARNLIEEASKTNNLATIREMRKKVADAIADAKIDAVSTIATDPEFAPNNLAAVRRLERGDAGRLSSVWNSMNFAEKAKVRDGLRSVYTDKVTAETRAKDEEHNSNLSLVNINVQRLIASDGNDQEAESILLSLSYRDPTAISPKDVAAIKKQAQDKEEPSYGLLTVLKENIFNDKYVNLEHMKQDAMRRGVSAKFIYSDLQPFFISRKDKAEGLIYQGINRAAGAEAGSINDKRVQRAKQSIEQEVQDRFESQKTLPAEKQRSKSDILKDVQKERAESQAQKIIDITLKRINESYGKGSADKKTNITFDQFTNVDEIAAQAARGNNNLKDIDVEMIRSDYMVIKKQLEILNPVRAKPAGAR